MSNPTTKADEQIERAINWAERVCKWLLPRLLTVAVVTGLAIFGASWLKSAWPSWGEATETAAAIVDPETEIEVEQEPIIIQQLVTNAEFCGAEVTSYLEQSVEQTHGWVPKVLASQKLEGVVYGTAHACIDTFEMTARGEYGNDTGAFMPDENITIDIPMPRGIAASIDWTRTDPADCKPGVIDRLGGLFGNGDGCGDVRERFNVDAHEQLLATAATEEAQILAGQQYAQHIEGLARAFGATGEIAFTMGGRHLPSSADWEATIITPTYLEQLDRGDGTCDMHDSGFQGPCIPADSEVAA